MNEDEDVQAAEAALRAHLLREGTVGGEAWLRREAATVRCPKCSRPGAAVPNVPTKFRCPDGHEFLG
jgi:hypothetical protein